MNIVLTPIGEIRPFPNNPRNISAEAIEAVANSIRAFGFRQPIVVDEAGVIIMGHTRREAAKLLGMTEVPVHTAKGLTPDQVKALRLVDNRTHELTYWDYDKLEEELDKVGSTELSDWDTDAAIAGLEEKLSISDWFPDDIFRETWADGDNMDTEHDNEPDIDQDKNGGGIQPTATVYIGPYTLEMRQSEVEDILESVANEYGSKQRQIQDGVLRRLGVDA